MKAKIKRWGINGEGIAYPNKKTVFISNAIPGEVVEFEVDEDKDRYASGHAVRILEKAPRRRAPICPHWPACGSCSLMHVDYKGQVRMKEQVLKEALKKYAGYTGPVEPIVKNPEPLGYRNACKLPFGLKDGKVITGMYEKGSNTFVPLERCIIHSRKLEQVRQNLHALLAQFALKPASRDNPEGLKTLVLKEFNDHVHVVFVTGGMELPKNLVDAILETIPDAASVWQSVKKPSDPDYELFGETVSHLGGEKKMTLQLKDYVLDLLPKSFFQLNTRQALALYELVASWVSPDTSLLVEAYSGIGAISLFAADRAKEVIGIEYIDDAVSNANANARLNQKKNVSFFCGDAATELEAICKTRHVDTLIVDPPRSGLNLPMKEAILKDEPETLIYISCNPATLGKDLQVLQKKYEIKTVQPFDFFSQTAHVETAVLLQKRDQGLTSRKQ